MSNKLKLKDLVLIALLTVIYLLIYIAGVLVVTVLGPFGHAVSPGIAALFGGAVIIFMNRKVGKMWEFTIFSILLLAAFTLMGGGYLPWYISAVSTAMIADLFASRGKDAPIWKLAVASGLMNVGQAWGSIIPSMFFLENYRSHWIERGVSAEEMDAMIECTSGILGFVATAVIFALSVAGIYIGNMLVRKHLERIKK